MKIITLLFLSLAFTACNANPKQRTDKQTAKPANQNGTAVVELFTSEGCSSCPPADKLLTTLQQEYGDRLISLSFHVDYWNRLGWKDEYSSTPNTQRQQQYATALRSESVYTPQAVVNGKAHLTGSNRAGLKELIDKELSNGKHQNMELIVNSSNDLRIEITYKVPLQTDEVLNIALVQNHATTNVKRGENSGRVLEHHNVVRDFKTYTATEGKVVMTLPAGLVASECSIIGYVQRRNMEITGARLISIL